MAFNRFKAIRRSAAEERLAAGADVWLVNLFFGAGPAPTGPFAASVANALQRRGVRVTVLAGRGARYAQAGDTADSAAQPCVRSLFAGSGRCDRVASRFVTWLCFYTSVLAFAFTRRLPQQVIVMTTPPLLHFIFALRNLFAVRKTRITLWNCDTYPEILAGGGLLRDDSYMYKALLALEHWAVARTDRVVVTDPATADVLRSHGAERIDVLDAWSNIATLTPTRLDTEVAERIGRAKATHRRLAIYTGNYGWGHDLTAILQTIAKRPHQTDVFWLFVGGGAKWHELQRFRDQHGATCMALHDYLPNSQMLPLMQRADFGVACLEEACQGLMAPCKSYGYLAAGKPILYLGPRRSNVAEIIRRHRCGWALPCNDAAGLEDLLGFLAWTNYDLDVMSANAAKAYRAYYNESLAVERFVAPMFDTSPSPTADRRRTSTTRSTGHRDGRPWTSPGKPEGYPAPRPRSKASCSR